MLKMGKFYPKWLNNEEYKKYMEFALEEGFANHKAKVAVNNKRMLVIDWCDKDGASNFAVTYILDKLEGVFMIHGDLGCAMACWYHSINLDDIREYLHSGSYFLDKMEAGEKYLWDYDKGRKELENRLYELKESYEKEGKDTTGLEEDFEEIKSLYEEYEENSYVNSDFYDLWTKYFDDEYFDIGRYVHPYVYYWVLGFFLACDDLASRDVKLD